MCAAKPTFPLFHSGDSIRCEKEDDEEYQHLVFEAKEGDRK